MPGRLHHLAQVNIALPREPLDTPLLRDFVAALDPVNAAAERSPGFIWRLKSDDGNATSIRAFGDERLLINLSVWESVDALREFAHSSGEHRTVLRRRAEWFAPPEEAHLALWWIPAGRTPTVTDAEERLAHLRRFGPTPHAFTFGRPFPATDTAP